MMPKILMVAAEFPPCLSAGVQRSYHFAENLLRNGWLPLVLSANPRVYKQLDQGVQFSPEIVENMRTAFAADASVHFAIKGKYFGFMENPDKIASWYHHGWRVGMDMIKSHEPDVIWSTFPVSTAHRIAMKLKKKTGIPWVADFRDPLHSHCDENYKRITNLAKKIDAATVAQANLLVFATQHMCDLYRKAYPDIDQSKFCVIENGYDERVFSTLQRSDKVSEHFTLLYSGGLYQVGRDPLPLFRALAELVAEGVIIDSSFRLKFRGAGDGALYQPIIAGLKLQGVVEFLPSISYRNSIQEMKDADALLVLQGSVFDNQIPGKVYEYIATGNPIVGLVGKGGASAALLRSLKDAFAADENDVVQIKQAIVNVLQHRECESTNVERYSRGARSAVLIEKLESMLISLSQN